MGKKRRRHEPTRVPRKRSGKRLALAVVIAVVVGVSLTWWSLASWAPFRSSERISTGSGSTPPRDPVASLAPASSTESREDNDSVDVVDTAEPALPPVKLPSENDLPIGKGPLGDETVKTLHEESLRVARRVLNDFPETAEALGLLGMVHDRLGQSTEALRYWRECLHLDPRRADVHDAMGILAQKRGDYEQAAMHARRVVELDDRIPGAYYRLAMSLMGVGELDNAIEALSHDLEIAPEAARSHLLLGQTYLQKSRFDEAKASYLAAVENAPEDMMAYHGLAQACARLGQRDEAAEYLTRSQQLRSEYWKEHTDQRSESLATGDLDNVRQTTAQSLSDAGRIYAGHRQLGQAETLWQRAAALDPANTPSRQALMSLYRASGRLGETLQLCEQLIELEPDNPRNYLSLGALWAQINRLDKAEAAYAQVMELAPEEDVGYRALAALYVNSNRKLIEAKKHAAMAVSLRPQAENFFVLAMICRKLNDLTGSREAIQEAVKLAPDNPRYVQFHAQLRRSQEDRANNDGP